MSRDIILRQPGAIYALSRPTRRRRAGERNVELRQVILTTHSEYLLYDPGIDGREILYITPGKDGSTVQTMADDPGMRDALVAGLMPGEIAPFRSSGHQLPAGLGLAG